MNCFYRVLKRLYDILFAVIFLALSSPFWAIAIVGIKCSSPGPVFYKSERVGKNHCIFQMLKFRSMHVNNAASTDQFVLAGSSLVFPFGALMRRTKIDELPQLVNILGGKLSVVGPRPCSPLNIDSIVSQEQKNVMLSMKPGLTSPGSLFEYIYGDSCTDNDYFMRVILPIKMEMECEYVKNASAFKDISVTARTAVIILQVLLKSEKYAFTKNEQRFVEKMYANDAAWNDVSFGNEVRI